MQTAIEASARAYAPYSKFPVGAALHTKDGKVFTGVNVENTSYGLTICAERSAVVSAVSAGETAFDAIAIYAPQATKTLYPCGACLQVLAEFADDMTILTQNGAGKNNKSTLKDLLPSAFKQ